MPLFNRHTISTFFLVIYFVWWALLLYWFLLVSLQPAQAYKATGATLFLFTFLVSMAYSAVLLVKAFLAKAQMRSDYFKFLALVISPAIIGILLFFIVG